MLQDDRDREEENSRSERMKVEIKEEVEECDSKVPQEEPEFEGFENIKKDDTDHDENNVLESKDENQKLATDASMQTLPKDPSLVSIMC